jgi:hypothetical protein
MRVALWLVGKEIFIRVHIAGQPEVPIVRIIWVQPYARVIQMEPAGLCCGSGNCCLEHRMI